MKENREWETLHRACAGGIRRFLLVGPPGVGKSTAAEAESAGLGLTSYQWSCCEDQLVQEALGHWVVRGQGGFVWHDGPWTRALRHGTLIINELPRASMSVRDAALSILDDPAICRISLPSGETIQPHAGFRVFCTSNDDPEEAGLCEALIDRFDLILKMTTPHPGLVQKLNQGYAGLGDVVARSFADGARAISPRRALAFLSLRAIFGEEEAWSLAFRERAADVRATMMLTKRATER